jgi:phage tail sheath protein FI
MYQHPGVYIEHVPSGVLAIEAASTSIAAFVGPVLRGPVDTPVLILNRGQFAREFGELDDSTSGIRDFGDLPDFFGHAVNAFYDNGGQQAFIVRVAKDDAKAATGALADPAALGAKGLYMKAMNPGAWGNKLVATIAPVDAADLALGYLVQIGYINADGDFEAVESFSGVSTDPNSGQYLPTILQQRSVLVNCEHLGIGAAPGGAQVSALKGGALHDLVINDLKNKTLDMVVNGVATKVKLATDLKKFDVTRDAGGVDDLATHTAAVAVASLADVARELTTAMALHPEYAGFSAYVSHDAQLVLVPPVKTDGTASSVTGAAGTLATALKLTGADGAVAVDYPAAGTASFLSGSDGGTVGTTDYDTAFNTLRDYREASILLTPGMVYDSTGQGAIDKAITHAEFMKNRVVIVDPKDPSVVANQLTTSKQVKDAALPDSSFSALYYPWLEVTNPHYDPDTRANRPRTHLIPPSGFAAGMWARVDGKRGVWKAPAGLETSVRGTQGPNLLIGNDLQDQLNEWGVNCIRNIIGPPVIWGARTLATKTQPDQRYVPVRRTSILIGESLYNALQAAVFEPNKHTLWSSLRASASEFMDGLFRAGAFQGEKASEAYYVLCGLGSTMTQGDIDAGIVRLVVGYAPLKPAEFVVVQIKQIVGQRG